MDSLQPQNNHDLPKTTQKTPFYGQPAAVVKKLKNNLVFRSKIWAEVNGCMGDLGTYIPIMLAVTLAKDLNLGATLIFTGIYNIITGAIYGVPMPVQPMKSIAAVAISNPDFGLPEIMAAGICTGGILFILGVTGLMQLAYKIIPLPVVRGIQLAQGLNFAMIAVRYIRKVQDFQKSKSVGDRHWLGLDGLILALVCACFIIVVSGFAESVKEEENDDNQHVETQEKKLKWRKIMSALPSAFIVFLLGLILAFARNSDVVRGFKFGPSSINVMSISRKAWKDGFVKGTIPQLPLSILNSVIAVCMLSSDLFPAKAKEVSATSVSVTVGLMNVIGCWFGVMPCCHGAGGLAGQYKFGGRSGGCVALLGLVKMILGLVFGTSLVRVLVQFPVGVLGVLLLFAGIELAICARDMNSKEDSFVMLVCTAVSLVGSSAALGFACGIVAYFLLRVGRFGPGKSCMAVWMNRNP